MSKASGRRVVKRLAAKEGLQVQDRQQGTLTRKDAWTFIKLAAMLLWFGRMDLKKTGQILLGGKNAEKI